MIIYTEKSIRATEESIIKICNELEVDDAAWIAKFWRKADGALLNDQILIYSTDTIAERNFTYNIASNHNGMLAVGDDSGGQAILTYKDQREEFYIVDHGNPTILCSRKFTSIEEVADYLLTDQCDGDPDVGNIATIAGVIPSLSQIQSLKKMPGVKFSILELRSKFGSEEQVIVSSVYFQKYQKYLDVFSDFIKFDKINK